MGERDSLDDLVNETFLDTVKGAVSEHYPKLVGVLGALATYKFMLEFGYFVREADMFKENPLVLSMPLVSGYLTYKGTNYYNRLRAYKKKWNLKSVSLALEDALYTPSAPGFRRIVDWVLEHPGTLGLALTAPRIRDIYNLFSNRMHDIAYFTLAGEPIPQDFDMKYGVALAFTSLISVPLFYACGNALGRILSAVFHSENIELSSKLFPAFFNHVIGRKEKYRQSVEEIVQTFPYPSAYHDLAARQAEEGSFDQAFLSYIKGMRLLKERGKLPFATIDNWLSLNDIPHHLNIVWKSEKKLRKEPESHTYLSLAFSHLQLNNPDGAIDVLDALSQEQGNLASHAGVLKVEVLDGVGRKKEATQELRNLFTLLRTTEYKKEFMGETTRDVYVFGPSEFIKGSILFKEDAIKKNLDFEAGLVNSLEDLVSGYEKYALPVQVAEIFDYEVESEKRFVYAERFVPSQSLLEKLEAQEFGDLEETFEGIADYLALLHSSEIIESVSEKGKLDFASKLEKKLCDENLGCSEKSVHRIIDNYAPVLNAFTFEEAIYAFNKDAHPENWLIAEHGTIVAIDFQDKGLVPIQFDLVNLVEYEKFMTYGEKIKVITDYIDSYNLHKGTNIIKDRKKFMLVYLNAVIQRAISLSSAWSSPDRTTMWGKRHVVMENALEAINNIERYHQAYYTQYKGEYDILRLELNEIRQRLLVQCKD